MTGSLTVKNDKFYLILNIHENGKRKKKWISTGLSVKGNKRKAEKMLREILTEYELKDGIVHSDTLMSDYVRLWLDQIRRTVDPVTLQGYQVLAETHIIPYFAEHEIRMEDIDTQIIQRYIDEKQLRGRCDGKGGLSPRSLRLHKNIITQALDMAVKEKLLLTNPCQFVIMPPIERHESKFYNASQLKKLFQALEEDPLLPVVKITVLYGLRRSELLGLQWDSIDFEMKTLTIKHTVAKVNQVVAKDKTKNASSHRTFPLTPDALEIFQTAKEQEMIHRQAFGSTYQENPYVFKWPDGHPYSPDYISHRFHDLLIQHELPLIRFHELRHSCASMLIAMGFTLKDVQEWLGHSDIKMTANIYAHLDFTRKNSMAASLNESFSFGGRKAVESQPL